MKQDIDRISSGLIRLLDEVEALLKSSAAGADRKLDEAELKGRETLRRICSHLRDARAEVVHGARIVDGAVQAHPWRALAVTAVLGFVAGLMVRRR
jgi:ElaB/YqjD/DUF883 family membrane-anchored ribosome-binding protein